MWKTSQKASHSSQISTCTEHRLSSMACAEDADHFLETGFKEADISDSADIISTVEFDHTGNYLATGDKGGRVVLFERNEMVCSLPPLPLGLLMAALST